MVGCFVGAGAMGTCNGWHERGAGAIRKHRGHPVCGSALAFACKPLHLHCAWRIESYHRQITACCLRVFVGHPVNYDVDTLDDLFADIGDHSLGQHRAGWTVAVFVSRNGRRANRANGTADAGLKPRAASMADRNSLDVVDKCGPFPRPASARQSRLIPLGRLRLKRLRLAETGVSPRYL